MRRRVLEPCLGGHGLGFLVKALLAPSAGGDDVPPASSRVENGGNNNARPIGAMLDGVGRCIAGGSDEATRAVSHPPRVAGARRLRPGRYWPDADPIRPRFAAEQRG